MTKVIPTADASNFLRSLKETSKFGSRHVEVSLQPASASKIHKTSEGGQSHKKPSNTRSSQPRELSREPHSPVPSSQNTSKARAKTKTTQIALYHFGAMNYSTGNQKKKFLSSNSAVEIELQDDPHSQTVLQQSVHQGLNSRKTATPHEQGISKQVGRGHHSQNNEYANLKNYAFNSNYPGFGYGSKPQSFSRKNVGSKDKTMSDVKSSKQDHSLPPISQQNSHRRKTSPNHTFENKGNSPHIATKFIQHIHLDTNPVNESEPIEEADPLNDAHRKEESNGSGYLFHQQVKPSVYTNHPLKEIKIDITNLETLENKSQHQAILKSSTSRNQEPIQLLSQRPTEKESQEKAVRPWRGISTPQGAIVNRPVMKQKTPVKPELPQKIGAVKRQQQQQPWKTILTDEEKKSYGDRFLEDYEKVDFLGRGGFALVWLGVERNGGRKVAVKQMLKGAATEAQRKELYYGQLLFGRHGEPREELRRYPGIQHIASFIEHRTTRHDDWFVSELGGKTLSKMLFDIKGEFFKGERIYRVKHCELSQAFQTDHYSLKLFIKEMAQVLHLLSDNKVVHCDLKPDNILMNVETPPPGKPFDLKVIDFGSAYTWNDNGNIGMATPEYMPPEFLTVLMNHKSNKSSIEVLMEGSKPWSVDIWSLGAILLEIITGVPLWMSLKCRVDIGSRTVFRMGLFAVKSRAYDKIYARQKTIMEDFATVLEEYADVWRGHEHLFHLVSLMLKWDPLKRISPVEILSHPYLQGV